MVHKISAINNTLFYRTNAAWIGLIINTNRRKVEVNYNPAKYNHPVGVQSMDRVSDLSPSYNTFSYSTNINDKVGSTFGLWQLKL